MGIFFGWGGSLLIAALTELVYAFDQWRTNLHELHQMENRNLALELEQLKQQVNPNFLFSCLNSLSELVSQAPSTAETFVDEMAKVYRYLLSVNGEISTNLTSLVAEIRYIRSYSFLLKVRFDEGINVHLNISDQFLKGQMVPLTLQTLVDNAMRYNSLSEESPLVIDIRTTEEGRLVVTNNQQKRTSRMPYAGADLSALVSRYNLLPDNNGSMEIREDDRSFTVTVPLMFR